MLTGDEYNIDHYDNDHDNDNDVKDDNVCCDMITKFETDAGDNDDNSIDDISLINLQSTTLLKGIFHEASVSEYVTDFTNK